MAADVKLLKAALEDARFDDPEIREKIYNCINSLADDLVEVNFSASITTDQIFDDLEEHLDTDVEVEVEDDDDDEEDEELSIEDEEEDDDLEISVEEEEEVT